MPADKILLGGDIQRQVPAGLTELMGRNYIYQILHARLYVPLHIDEHLEIADNVMRNIYGCGTGATIKAITENVAEVIRANRYPRQANAVIMRVFPGDRNKPDILLECLPQLYYPRYTLWHKRITAVILPCEYIFMGYPTAVSYATSSFARTYAISNGAEEAIIENCNSVLANINDEPLFLVKGKNILTSPLEEGAADSVMRRMVFRAAEKEGINVIAEPLTRQMLEACDEAFFPTVQGITSLRGFGGRSYFYITAGRIAETIEKLSVNGI